MHPFLSSLGLEVCSIIRHSTCAPALDLSCSVMRGQAWVTLLNASFLGSILLILIAGETEQRGSYCFLLLRIRSLIVSGELKI